MTSQASHRYSLQRFGQRKHPPIAFALFQRIEQHDDLMSNRESNLARVVKNGRALRVREAEFRGLAQASGSDADGRLGESQVAACSGERTVREML